MVQRLLHINTMDIDKKKNNVYIYKWQRPSFGAHSGVRKNITHRKPTEKKTKIKDGHNCTKIGASNVFGGNQLRFRISAH